MKVISDRIEDLEPQGRCLERGCNWDHGPSKETNAEAKAHTKETGHRTRSVRCRVIEYVRVE